MPVSTPGSGTGRRGRPPLGPPRTGPGTRRSNGRNGLNASPGGATGTRGISRCRLATGCPRRAPPEATNGPCSAAQVGPANTDSHSATRTPADSVQCLAIVTPSSLSSRCLELPRHTSSLNRAAADPEGSVSGDAPGSGGNTWAASPTVQRLRILPDLPRKVELVDHPRLLLLEDEEDRPFVLVQA